MSARGTSTDASVPPTEVLTEVTYDTIPTPNFNDVISTLGSDSRIALGTPERFGMGPTVEKTIEALEDGYHPVPHLVARFIDDRDHLDRIANQLSSAGLEEIFVVGGDCESPMGVYSCALDILEGLEELGYSFDEVGIGGHPSGHEIVSDETLMESLERKQSHATYIVTQICLETSTILNWTESVREHGIDLPIEIGIPGVVNFHRLIFYARQWGLAKPIQFLRKTTGIMGFFKEFLRHRGRFVPKRIVREIAPFFADPYYNFNRVRLYTFNQVQDTQNWRQTFMSG